MSASGIVKISDFGFACFLDGNTEVVAELPTDSKPLRWMAPEAFEDNLFSEASDVYVVVTTGYCADLLYTYCIISLLFSI